MTAAAAAASARACPARGGRASPPPRPPDMSEHKAVDPKLSTTDRVVKGGCCAPAALSAGSSRRAPCRGRVRRPFPASPGQVPRGCRRRGSWEGWARPGGLRRAPVEGLRLPSPACPALHCSISPPSSPRRLPPSALKALHRAGVRERGSPSFLPRPGAWGRGGLGSALSPSPPAPLGIPHSSFSSGPRSPEPPRRLRRRLSLPFRSPHAARMPGSLPAPAALPHRAPLLGTGCAARLRRAPLPQGRPRGTRGGDAGRGGAGRGRCGRRRKLLPPPPPSPPPSPPPPSPSLADGPAC